MGEICYKDLRIFKFHSHSNSVLLLGQILIVTDLFLPIRSLSLILFYYGDVGHGVGRRCPVPVFFTGSDPDHISGVDLLDGSAP
jgi:hypothetical protein